MQQNSKSCDPKTGACSCKAGWRGVDCDNGENIYVNTNLVCELLTVLNRTGLKQNTEKETVLIIGRHFCRSSLIEYPLYQRVSSVAEANFHFERIS